MTAEPTDDHPEQIVRDDHLDDEDYQVRELFAQFGLAAYTAQTLEKGLVNIATIAEGNDNPRTTQRDYDAIFESTNRKTMGGVLKALKPYLNDDTALIGDLELGLATRNRLAHSFFWEHAADFMNVSGRERMLAELHLATEELRALDARLAPVIDRLLAARGIGQELKQQLLDEAMAALLKSAADAEGE